MSKRISYRQVRQAKASPETVFEVLNDVPGWKRWAPLVAESRWEDDSKVGVGAIRLVGAKGFLTREQITIHDPGRRHGYTILADKPARDYQSVVELTSVPGGTLIDWSGSFVPNPPVVGHAYAVFVRWFIGKLADGLVKESERRS